MDSNTNLQTKGCGRMKCKTHDMQPSKAIMNGVSGRVTMWYDPKKWKLAECLKCKNCGYSTTKWQN